MEDTKHLLCLPDKRTATKSVLEKGEVYQKHCLAPNILRAGLGWAGLNLTHTHASVATTSVT